MRSSFLYKISSVYSFFLCVFARQQVKSLFNLNLESFDPYKWIKNIVYSFINDNVDISWLYFFMSYFSFIKNICAMHKLMREENQQQPQQRSHGRYEAHVLRMYKMIIIICIIWLHQKINWRLIRLKACSDVCVYVCVCVCVNMTLLLKTTTVYVAPCVFYDLILIDQDTN